MTFNLLLQALLQYGPTVIPLAQKLVANIEAGKSDQTVTKADLDELVRLSIQSSGDIYLRLGIEPPPARPS